MPDFWNLVKKTTPPARLRLAAAYEVWKLGSLRRLIAAKVVALPAKAVAGAKLCEPMNQKVTIKNFFCLFLVFVIFQPRKDVPLFFRGV
ncbi:MAG: hypothetical protein V1716_02110 [Candidatus Uhrbacteria bacterium]